MAGDNRIGNQEALLLATLIEKKHPTVMHAYNDYATSQVQQCATICETKPITTRYIRNAIGVPSRCDYRYLVFGCRARLTQSRISIGNGVDVPKFAGAWFCDRIAFVIRRLCECCASICRTLADAPTDGCPAGKSTALGSYVLVDTKRCPIRRRYDRHTFNIVLQKERSANEARVSLASTG